MSEEKQLSEGKVVDLLQGIWGEMKIVNGRINDVRDGLSGVREELVTTRGELSSRINDTNARLEFGFARMDQRFDQFLRGVHGKEHREFRKRLARLEAHSGLAPYSDE